MYKSTINILLDVYEYFIRYNDEAMQKRVSLRRASIQEKRAQRQGVVAIVVGIVLLLLFIFVLIPLLFDGAVRFARRGGKGNILNSDTLPPQRPMVTPLSEHSKSTNFEVKGFTEAKAHVTLVVDGSVQSETEADNEGAFTFAFTMSEGEHEVWVVAEDEAKNMSPESERFPVKVDTTTPSLTIESPQAGAVFTLPRERVLSIKGKASEKGTVFVNGSRVTTAEDGTFSSTFTLGNGGNEITFRVEDEAGNTSDEQKISVEYKP
jgi:hypothetical protein